MAAVRVFCLAKQVPTLRECLTFAAGAGEGVRLAPAADGTAATDADSPGWRAAHILYRDDAPALAVQLLRRTDDDTRFLDLLHRFLAALDGVEQTDAMRAVRYHLAETRFVAVVELPADGDGDAFTAAAWFTRCFVERYEGLLQADGEGFYSPTGDLTLPLSR